METTIKSLQDIGYTGELTDQKLLEDALSEGAKSISYTTLISYLTNELRPLCTIDEQVNPITAAEDSVSFLMELSSFLKELGCPYENLTQGHISDRLSDIQQRKILIDYLTTELMAARMIQDTKPDNTIALKIQESKEAANLKKILVRLRFPKPPANLSIPVMFNKVIASVEAEIKKHGVALVGAPIFNLTLTDKQWYRLEQVQKDLHTEYTIRREMLLKRLDCTIQSFQWSDKMKGKDEAITTAYSGKRKQMKVEPGVDISDLLAAREDLAIIEKTSNASVRKHTKSSINRVIIGNVPDRGGRTNELAPPPPEMPSWQQRTPGSGGGPRGGGGGGNRGGRGRGDFNRGGGGSNYTRGGGSNFSGDHNRGGSNYNKAERPQSDYSRGSSYNQSGGSYNQTGVGSSQGDYSQGGSSYNQSSGSNYNQGGRSYSETGNTYNKQGGGGYSHGNSSYSQGGNSGGQSYERSSSGGQSYERSNSGGQSYERRSSGGSTGFDSAGSYGIYQEPKRPKTYDTFQNQKTTYADQYVQESQQNRQYSRGGGGRGRSNYNRGGY